MRLILLDENLPTALWQFILDHDVRSVAFMGWSGLKNGELIAAAEASGFEILVTADQGIRYQQNLTRRQIAMTLLSANVLPIIQANLPPLRTAIACRDARQFHARRIFWDNFAA